MTIAEVDRMFFEYIRLKLVELNLLPDITLYSTEQEYNNAKDNIRNNLPSNYSLVEVLGVGSSYEHGETTTAQFIIERKGFSEGSFGMYGVITYEEYKDNGVTKFRKLQFPSGVYNISYEIRLITDNSFMERLMNNILLSVFSIISNLHPVNSDGTFSEEYIEIRKGSSNNVSVGSDLIEYVSTYEVIDVMLEDMKIISDNLVPLSTVEFYTYI